MDISWRLKLLLTISSWILIQNTNAACTLLTILPKVNDLCAAFLECDQSISFERSSWKCIQSQKYIQSYNDYGYYRRDRGGHYETVYAEDFYLNISLKDATDEKDIFESFPYKKNIIQLKIGGSLTAVPQSIYQLNNVKELIIEDNSISVMDLYSILEMNELTRLALNNNGIAALNIESPNRNSVSRSLIDLDLSHNLLNSIPDTSFSLFTNMQYLNLSHNLIQSFNILTFEGILRLKTIDLSHNLLFEIGNSLYRFKSLKVLYLQNNKLSKLSENNLSTLLKLETLNLSSNIIEIMENNTFKSLTELKNLDLSDNKIKIIEKNLLETNDKLESLFISNNNINHIEDGAFDGKTIIEFNLNNNNLTGLLNQNSFKGIFVDIIDLSNGSIIALGDDIFTHMQLYIKSVNFSSNKINTISQSTFKHLGLLDTLDLSHNKLEELNFTTSDLQNLTTLYLQNNNIKSLSDKVFLNLISLNYLDLSYNKIAVVKMKTFKDLNATHILKITNNNFNYVMENNTFEGMVGLTTVDMSFIRTTVFKNASFSGLPNLVHINSSHGQLSQIEYNAFIKTGSIEIIDVSHNLLENFHINISSIHDIQEIHLHNNALGYITNYTFSGLRMLRILNLDKNNIHKMEGNAFENVQQLSHLTLSSNMNIEIMGDPFRNLKQLFVLNLNNVKKSLTFQNKTVQAVNLDLHLCGIKDLNKLYIFNVNKLRELNLSLNAITKIDKFSFQNLASLTHLDLSSNRINYIQPGSFLHVSELRTINLQENNLQSLQFGVFDGIENLNFVNLSNNAIEYFDIKLLPSVLILALDCNNIRELAFEDIFESKIQKLSIGCNQISCKALVELKNSKFSEKFHNVVSTARPNFHSENVDGISCVSNSNDKGLIMPAINNTTSYDIRPVFTELTNTIKDLHTLIDTRDQNSSHDKSNDIKSELNKLVNSIQFMVNDSRETQKIQTENFIKELAKISNNSNLNLRKLIVQILNHTDTKQTVDSDVIQRIVDSSKDSDDIRLEMKKMVQDEINAIREEFSKSIQKSEPVAQTHIEKEVKDDKVQYFIAAFLGIFIVLYISNILYKYVTKRNRGFSHHRHGSIRPIASDIELE